MKSRRQHYTRQDEPIFDIQFVLGAFLLALMIGLISTLQGLFFPTFFGSSFNFNLAPEFQNNIHLDSGSLTYFGEYLLQSTALSIGTFFLPLLAFRILCQWGWRNKGTQRSLSIVCTIIFIAVNAKLHFSNTDPSTKLWLIVRTLFVTGFLITLISALWKLGPSTFWKTLRIVSVIGVGAGFVGMDYWQIAHKQQSTQKQRLIFFLNAFNAESLANTLDIPELNSLRQRMIFRHTVLAENKFSLPQTLTMMSGLTPPDHEIRTEYPPAYLLAEANEIVDQSVPRANRSLRVLGGVHPIGWLSDAKSPCSPDLKTLQHVRFYESNPLLFTLIKSKWLLNRIPFLACTRLLNPQSVVQSELLTFLSSDSQTATFAFLDPDTTLTQVLRTVEDTIQSLDAENRIEIYLIGLATNTQPGNLVWFSKGQQPSQSKMISGASLDKLWNNGTPAAKKTVYQEDVSEPEWITTSAIPFQKPPQTKSVSFVCRFANQTVTSTWIQSESRSAVVDHVVANEALPMDHELTDEAACRTANETALANESKGILSKTQNSVLGNKLTSQGVKGQ